MRVDPATTRTLFHRDPQVQEVLDIWTARFLAGQIPLGDLTATIDRIDDWSDWGPEWAATARVHEEMGELAWDEGRLISAVDAFLTAARCYHLSYFLSVDDEEAHSNGLAKMLECRAAAFEPRVTAAVANCGPYSWIDCWDELPEVTRGAFRKYSWSKSDEEAREKARALDLSGLAEKITQPLVVVHGMLDPLIGVDHARRIAEEAPNATLITVDDATHGVSNLSYRFAPLVDDWMAQRLGARIT